MTNRFYCHTAGGLCFTLLVLGFISRAGAQGKPDAGWPNYGNEGGGTRYSPASQIDRRNVGQLKPAWTYRSGALPHDPELDKKAAFEATPILVGGKLFLASSACQSRPAVHVAYLHWHPRRTTDRVGRSHRKAMFRLRIGWRG